MLRAFLSKIQSLFRREKTRESVYTAVSEDKTPSLNLEINTLERLEEVIEIFQGLVDMFPDNKQFRETLKDLHLRREEMLASYKDRNNAP